MTTYRNSANQPQEAPDSTVEWTASDSTIQDGLPDEGSFANAANQAMDGADRLAPYRDSAGNLLGAARMGASVAPTNLTAPIIVGAAVTGVTLRGTPGAWGGTSPMGYYWRWQFAQDDTGPWSDIGDPLGSAQQLVLPGDSTDLFIRVRVTAKNVVGSTEAFSDPIGPVIAA